MLINMLGKPFETISQRVIYSLMFSMTDLNSIESDMASKDEQHEMHAFLSNLLYKLYELPDLLNLPITEDTFYPEGVCDNHMPKIINLFRKIYKELSSLYTFMLMVGLHGKINGNRMIVPCQKDIVTKKSYRKLFESFGIKLSDETCYTLTYDGKINIFNAWKLLANKSIENNSDLNMARFYFYSCSYDHDYKYWLNRVDQMYGLTDGMLTNCVNELYNRDYKISFKSKLGNNGLEVGVACENKIGGITFSYHFREKDQIRFSSKNGIGFKSIVDKLELHDDDIQSYVIENSAKCWGCKQCTKGKDIPIFARKYSFKGDNYTICPCFPKISWHTITKSELDRLLKIVELQQSYALN